MSDSIAFAVAGQPVPKQSYRAVNGGGYTPPRVKAWQELVAIRAKEAMQGRELFQGPIAMRVIFLLKDHRRVDLDNLNKGVSDALNGIIFTDDSQVVDLHLFKRVTDNPILCGIYVQVHQGEFLPNYPEIDFREIKA